MDSPALVDITRRTGYFGCVRKMKIFVNGVEVAFVNEGQAVRVPVSPGQSYIFVRMDWWVSPEIMLDGSPGGVYPFLIDIDWGRAIVQPGFWIPFMKAACFRLSPLGPVAPPVTPYPRT